MGRINRLPPRLANQIAAGEVVERPASVVKELVENALDAGAGRVGVVIEAGGKGLIRVEDDGEGMSPEDAALAVERHATSKLARLEDLGAISTHGFRGEALPSIASVSRLTLRTRARGASGGAVVRVEGGTAAPVRAAGAPEGTIVEVADLFYNVPARRKFLKSDAAEARQVSRVMTQVALANPELGFRLTSGRRQLLACQPVATLADRFFQVYGERADLVAVGRKAAGIQVTGYAASLAAQGPANAPQNIFVNRRPVRDRTISHAISQAYARATIKPRRPEVHLFIELPPDRVDVNVHPTKAEVRFLEQSLVHEILRRALRDALGEAAPPAFGGATGPELALAAPAGAAPEPVSQSIPGVVAGLRAANPWAAPAGTGGHPASGRHPGAPGSVRDTGAAAAGTGWAGGPARADWPGDGDPTPGADVHGADGVAGSGVHGAGAAHLGEAAHGAGAAHRAGGAVGGGVHRAGAAHRGEGAPGADGALWNDGTPGAGGTHAAGGAPGAGATHAAGGTLGAGGAPGAGATHAVGGALGAGGPHGGQGPLVPLGQLRDTFIIAVDNDGLAIIDQHVAHERILFEQVMARLSAGRLESQRLLEPLLVELPPPQRAALEAHAADLARLGFEVEPFGGGSVRVAATPALLPRTACARAVRELADDLDRLERDAGIDEGAPPHRGDDRLPCRRQGERPPGRRRR